MDEDPLRRLIRSLGQLAEPGGVVGPSDADLLERFAARQDGAAFELLLRRHGAMVLGVCRRLLADPHDAEDAFQATFLTLVRRAGSIARGAAVASWLYRVAFRAALRLRAGRAKQAAREQRGVELLAAPPPEDAARRELGKILDEEVGRLPERWRSVFVLCDLEGKTGAEAAQELRCPPGTVSSRLTRARARLCHRLTRRGLAPAVAALAAAQSGEAFAVPLPAPLVAGTLQACLWFSTGHSAGGGLSAPAVTLAEGVLRAMFLSKVKSVALVLLVLTVLAAGGVLTRNALTAGPPPAPVAKADANPRGPAAGPGAKKEAPAPAPAPQAKNEKALQKDLVKEARKVWELDMARLKNLGGVAPEELYRWSRRWLEAARDLATKQEARTAALREHLGRMQELERFTTALWKTGQGREADAVAARYYRTQAELWLAREPKK